MNPLQGKSSVETSTVTLSIKQEEPTSTVEMATNSSSSTDCVSLDLDEASGPDSATSVAVSASPDSIPSVNVNDSPDSVPSVTVSASPRIKESPQSHSSSSISSSSDPLNTNQDSPQTITTLHSKSNSKNHSSCLPDSTTQNSSGSSCQPRMKNADTKLNHPASSSDQGYHSISSSRGGQMMASIGNESELSGASSCVYKSSPESLQYPPISPDYPQSVFSSDGSLPPPSNHVTHLDSPKLNHSQPGGTTVLHHPNGQLSHVMTPVTQLTQPVKQMTQSKPVTSMIPVKQVTPTHQMPASDVYPQHYIYGQPMHGDNFGMHSQISHQHLGHQLHTDGRRTVIVGNGYGTPHFPQQNYSTVMNDGQNEGTNPANYVFPRVKAEPTSPPYYTPPYMSGNPVPPQPQGAAAIFTAPHYLEGQGFYQQSVGSQMFTASATVPGKGTNM